MEKDIKDIIEELNSIDVKWQKKVIDSNGLEELYKNEYGEVLSRLLDSIRQFIKIEKEKELEDILDVLDNKKVTDVLINYANDTLVHYNNMVVLRELEKQNNENFVIKLLEDAFENFVLRFDYSFIETYNSYNIESSEEMRNILRSIDCLAEYYVRRLFTRKNIREDFYSETGLSEECCEKYAQLVDENFKEIRMNIIMQDTEYIRQTILN